MSGLFVSQTPFPFQIWPDIESNQNSTDRPGELLRPLTCSCFFLLLLRRLFLLAVPFLHEICLPSLWSSLFPLHAFALIFLSLAKVRCLLTLALSPLMIGCSKLMALFCFLLTKAARVYLPTALSVALRPLFHSLFKFLCRSLRHSACSLLVSAAPTSLPLLFSILLSDSRSVLTTLSSPPSFFSPQTLWQIYQELSFFFSCSIRLQSVPGLLFLPGNNAADELTRRGELLGPSAIPCSLFLLISHIQSCLFSDWRRTVSLKFFDTQVPSISTKELVLPRYARCVFSRLRCNGHSLLLSFLSL